MNEFVKPSDRDRAAARQRFGEYELEEELATAQPVSTTVPISRLYAVTSAPGAAMPTGVAEALMRQPQLRAIYRDLLARGARFQILEAMAASTDELTRRDGPGCHIRFEDSHAESNQIYVIVELDDPEGLPPAGIAFCDAQDFCAGLALTVWRNGVAQAIIDRDSDFLRLARDPKSTAYLR